MLIFGEVVFIDEFLRDVHYLYFEVFGMIMWGPKVKICIIKACKFFALAG